MTPLVGVVMGSQSDWPTMRHCADLLTALGVPHEVRVVSAHRTPDRLRDYAGSAVARAAQVIVAGAGGAHTILLDEPTAGMSRHETERAVALIRRVSEDRTLVMIEHDLGVVFDLADRISVLADGRVIASGPPGEIRGNQAVRTAYLGAAADALH